MCWRCGSSSKASVARWMDTVLYILFLLKVNVYSVARTIEKVPVVFGISLFYVPLSILSKSLTVEAVRGGL